MEHCYFLTKWGTEFLRKYVDLDMEIKDFSYASVFLHDYFHRLGTIDFHIRLWQWITANGGKLEFDMYFEHTGSRRNALGFAKNRIVSGDPVLIPDGMGKVRT